MPDLCWTSIRRGYPAAPMTRFLRALLCLAAFVALAAPQTSQNLAFVVPAPPAAPGAPAAPAPPAAASASWPWDGLPRWKEAQEHPQAYEEWLRAQHPTASQIRREWALVTAYTPHAASCAPYDDGRTAVGADAWSRGIAVDRWSMRDCRKTGTAYHVPGYMWKSCPGQAWVPDDCGSAMDHSRREGRTHIDVRYHNHQWALEHWGRREGWVFVIEP